MKVLVAGAQGQVGRALLAAAPDDCELVPIGRAELDITDARQVGAALIGHRPDMVINAAAYTAVDKAESEPDLAFAINRDGAANLAKSAAEAGARFIHLSTDFVFDGSSGRPYMATDKVAPLSVYGSSKAAGEEAVLQTSDAALIVRTAWVYAAQGANFVGTMLRLMKERDSLRVVADQVGTPTHAASLARALWKLTACDARGIHHYTDAGVASWYDFACAIQEEALAAGLLPRQVEIVPIPASDYPTPARRPSFGLLDKTTTYALLGGPAAHWRTELRAAITMMKEHVHA